jgi:hypothetical protein
MSTMAADPTIIRWMAGCNPALTLAVLLEPYIN